MMLKRNTKFKGKIGGWSLAMITIFGLFSYLTFIPRQTFAAYDWETRKLSDITTMQDMNTKICENTTKIGAQYQLEDARDHKRYWVSKLADGNCWMTQNLDYDGGGVSTPLADWPSSDSFVGYYDPGDYYEGPDGSHAYGITCNSNVGLSECGQFSISDADRHYHVGNYYSWPAATIASSGEEQDESSVCPKGWKLPNGRVDGDFEKLMQSYGWIDNTTQSNSIGDNGIYGAPLYFVFGGYLHGGELTGAGHSGVYWSSTPVSTISAFVLLFESTVRPRTTLGTGQYYGYSVRCLASLTDYPELDSEDEANVSVTVSPVVSLDVVQNAVSEVDFTTIAESTIITNVSSNQQYQVLLSTDQSTLEQNPPVAGQNIPMLTNDSALTAGTSAWGVKKKLSAIDGTKLGSTEDNTVYSPIGTSDDKALFYKSNGPEALTTATGEPLTFAVGITVNAQLPSGTYATTATVTAVAM